MAVNDISLQGRQYLEGFLPEDEMLLFLIRNSDGQQLAWDLGGEKLEKINPKHRSFARM